MALLSKIDHGPEIYWWAEAYGLSHADTHINVFQFTQTPSSPITLIIAWPVGWYTLNTGDVTFVASQTISEGTSSTILVAPYSEFVYES